jgi:hypothetical protein
MLQFFEPFRILESEKKRGRLKDKIALHADVAKIVTRPKLPNPSSIG